MEFAQQLQQQKNKKIGTFHLENYFFQMNLQKVEASIMTFSPKKSAIAAMMRLLDNLESDNISKSDQILNVKFINDEIK